MPSPVKLFRNLRWKVAKRAASKGSPREAAERRLSTVPDSASLAREDADEAARCSTTVLRVEWLERYLARGKYQPTVTDFALARLWGITRDSVGNVVGEAWRRLASQHSPERSEEVRAEFIARIRSIGDAALNRKREALTMEGEVVALADPDCRTALQAVVEMATLVGIREQRWRGKVDVSAMSEEAILEQLEKQGYSVAKRSAAVLTEGEEVEKKP